MHSTSFPLTWHQCRLSAPLYMYRAKQCAVVRYSAKQWLSLCKTTSVLHNSCW